jgi:hypothetical protein
MASKKVKTAAIKSTKKSKPAKKLKKVRPVKTAIKKQRSAATLASQITKHLKQGQRHRAVLEEKFWKDEDCSISYTEDEKTHSCEGEEEERF